MTRQLVLVEARRLLRNLYLWAAVAATLALLVWGHWHRQPNLAAATVDGAMATFLVAATMMVVANLATLRDQRHGMPETLAALPGRADARTRAVLVAAGGLGAVLAGAVIAAFLLIRLTQGVAAGRVDLREVAAAMLSAAILAAFGVALGRWLPSLIAAPVVLAVFVMGTAVLGTLLLVWYLPVTGPYEMQSYGRPIGPRVLFLTGALILLAALALLRYGPRPLRLGAAATALAIVVPAATAVWAAAPENVGVLPDATGPPWEPEHECVTRHHVTYCHLPGFGSWIPLWAAAADPVAAAVPDGARDRLPVITQRSGWRRLDARSGEVVVDLTWGRGDAELSDRLQLAGLFAGLTTGLTDPTRSYADDQAWCDGRGQARTVVTLWLAGHAGPVQPATPDRNWDGAYLETSYVGSGVGYGDREVRYAEALLAKDDARERVAEHWDTLIDPGTGLAEALPLLGLAKQFPPEEPQGRPCD